MPAEVKILVEGYSNANSVGETGEEKTRPTISLVRDDGIIMVVDPGALSSQQILVDALQEENLTVDDVNVVCITHSHIDHYRNIGMFPNAKNLEFYGLWDKESVEPWSENFSTNIQIMHTPGHDHSGITLFVNTNNGMVAICGDVFWEENYPESPHDDAYASDAEKLQESRKVILKMADWIIPGHGKIYKAKGSAIEETDKAAGFLKKREQKVNGRCRKCRRLLGKDKCLCRSWLCIRCCECGMDCDLCGCSHKRG